jgi:hypothetical protein
MSGVEACVGIGMQNARLGNPSVQQWGKSLPPHLCSLTATRRADRGDLLEHDAVHQLQALAGGIPLLLRELTATHVRYGYRRLTVLLRREGWKVNASGSTGFMTKRSWKL